MSSQALMLHPSGLRSRRTQNNIPTPQVSLPATRRVAGQIGIRSTFDAFARGVVPSVWRILFGLITLILFLCLLPWPNAAVERRTSAEEKVSNAQQGLETDQERHLHISSQDIHSASSHGAHQDVNETKYRPGAHRNHQPRTRHHVKVDLKHSSHHNNVKNNSHVHHVYKGLHQNRKKPHHGRKDRHQDVRKGHKHKSLAGKEQELHRLPHTHWLHNAALSSFAPGFKPSLDMKLITLGQACYCTYREQFILPKFRAHGSFPAFMRRHPAVRHISWKTPEALLAHKGQKVVFVNGVTVLWRGRGINMLHPHLQRALMPIRSILDELKKTPFGANVKLAVESFTSHGKLHPAVGKLQEYFIGDVPSANRISLEDHRPRLLCFDRVISLGTEFEGHTASQISFNRVKDLIERSEKGHLKKGLIRDCREEGANKNTIWVVDRQQSDGAEGTISNMAEVTTGVNHELMRAGLADVLEMKTIQGPYVRCAPGTSLEGCLGTQCDNSRGGCERRESPLLEVETFNNMTIMIASAGPAMNGVSYMPRGASVIEIVPHGVVSTGTDRDVARSAQVELWQMRNKADGKVERWVREEFGDVGRESKRCWSDDECRAARLSFATKVDVRHLRVTLRKVFKQWRRTCRVGL